MLRICYILILFNLFLALSLIIGGAVCGFANDTCSDQVGASLIGMGVGLFFASLLSFVLERAFNTPDKITQHDLSKIRTFVGIKFLCAFILLIIAYLNYDANVKIGSGLVGAGCGVLVGSFFNLIYCIPRHN